MGLRSVKALLSRVAANYATVIEVCGLLVVTAGVALIYLPLGLIMLGAGAVILAQGLEVKSS
jgi:hypothetical protein